MRRTESRRAKKKGRLKRFLLFLTLILGLTILSYAGYVGFQMYTAWNKIYDGGTGAGQAKEDSEEERTQVSHTEPFSVLLLGVDSQGMGDTLKGRSDSMMLAVVNPEKEKVSLLSIPRDTYVTIADTGEETKINHALYGGVERSKKTVENFLGIDIDYWFALNFEAFEAFIDDVMNGVEVEVEKNIPHEKDPTVTYIPQGRQVLNGEEALYYVRFRKDREGDFGRMRRQRQMVGEIMDQSLNLRTVSKVSEILNIMGDNVRTNIPPSELLNMATTFSSMTSDNLETMQMEGDARYASDGISYVFVPEEERQRVQEELNRLLNPALAQEEERSIQTEARDEETDQTESRFTPSSQPQTP